MNTQTSSLVSGVDFIAVPTQDFEKASEFYENVLGLEPSKRWGDMPAREYETGSLTILPYGAVTRGCLGAEMAEIGLLREAGACAFTDGQRAVAQVILNRVRHPAYPPSVCGVVYQGSTRKTGCWKCPIDRPLPSAQRDSGRAPSAQATTDSVRPMTRRAT